MSEGQAVMREVAGDEQAAPQTEPRRFGIVQTITSWNDAEKKLTARVLDDERPFRSDEAGRIEAEGEHRFVTGDPAVVCCTTVLRELSLSGPGRVVAAWHYALGLEV